MNHRGRAAFLATRFFQGKGGGPRRTFFPSLAFFAFRRFLSSSNGLALENDSSRSTDWLRRAYGPPLFRRELVSRAVPRVPKRATSIRENVAARQRAEFPLESIYRYRMKFVCVPEGKRDSVAR